MQEGIESECKKRKASDDEKVDLASFKKNSYQAFINAIEGCDYVLVHDLIGIFGDTIQVQLLQLANAWVLTNINEIQNEYKATKVQHEMSKKKPLQEIIAPDNEGLKESRLCEYKEIKKSIDESNVNSLLGHLQLSMTQNTKLKDPESYKFVTVKYPPRPKAFWISEIKSAIEVTSNKQNEQSGFEIKWQC